MWVRNRLTASDAAAIHHHQELHNHGRGSSIVPQIAISELNGEDNWSRSFSIAEKVSDYVSRVVEVATDVALEIALRGIIPEHFSHDKAL